MKRYWKIISLFIVTVMVVGTFYIQIGLTGNGVIQIDVEKVNGNVDEIKDIMIYGTYEVGNMHQSFRITNTETFNLENQSLLQELINNNTHPVMKKLIKQYRNFMRGKELMPNYFYEDENRLAYVSIKEKNLYGAVKNISFDIDVLNRKSEETTAIQLDMPVDENYGYMDVIDVQIIESELKVILRGFRMDGGNDLKVYTIDIDAQKVVNDEMIHSTPTVKNGGSDIRLPNDYYSIEPQKYLLYKIAAYEDKMVQDEGDLDGEPNIITNEVRVYDLEKNQSKKINVPDEILESIIDLGIFNSTIFIPSKSESGFEVNQYDIEKDKWGKKLTFDLLDNPNNEGAPYSKLMKGKIVIIQATNSGHSIFIRDLKTGESLYEGKLKVKNKRDDQKDYHLYVNEIESVH